MNRTTHHVTRLAALATTVLGLLVVTTGRALAQNPVPGPGGTGSPHDAPVPAPAQPIVEASISVLQWTLFATAVVAALVIGAALMNLAQRRRGVFRIADGQAAARS